MDSIFEKQLSDYFKYIFNLINDIFDFELLYKLFNIEKLSEKAINEYITNLNKKLSQINLKFDRENEKEYNKILNLIVILIDINIRKQNNKALSCLDIVEKKCQDEIYDIYILLLNANDNIQDEKILNKIFSKFKASNNYIETSILLLTKIKDDRKKKRFFSTLKGYTFQLKDFFTQFKDNKIKFYITLNDKNLIDKDSDFYKSINNILNEISEKMSKFEIEKSNIESFLELKRIQN